MSNTFSATIEKYTKKDDKYGWTYIIVPDTVASKLNPGVKKSFKVKGLLEDFAIAGVSLLPAGGGSFLMALNANIRKGLGKSVGSTIKVTLEMDHSTYQLDADLVACLEEESEAARIFYAMPLSHQHYYSKWIESAKTTPTRTKRIAMTIDSLLKGLDFGAMLRKARDDKKEWGL